MRNPLTAWRRELDRRRAWESQLDAKLDVLLDDMVRLGSLLAMRNTLAGLKAERVHRRANGTTCWCGQAHWRSWDLPLTQRSSEAEGGQP